MVATQKEGFFFSLAPFSPCSYFYLRSIFFFFQKYTEAKTYFQTDVLQIGSSILLSLQAITSERPRQMGSLWKHHHWPRQLSLRAPHTVNTITRPSEWRQPLDRHMLPSERWQHRQAQTSVRALVWAFWSTAINFQYFKYVFECFRISIRIVQSASHYATKYHRRVTMAVTCPHFHTLCLSVASNVLIFSP